MTGGARYLEFLVAGMGHCGKVSAAKLALLVVAAMLLWRFNAINDTSLEDTELQSRLESEKRTCLWRKGLEENRILGDRSTFSTFNCPVGLEAYPQDLCTAHVLYLNHTERKFVARTPSDHSSR